jgi:hypothetical protein
MSLWDEKTPSSPFLLTSVDREIRIKICEECPHLAKAVKICGHCGCFMPIKTWIRTAKCPIDKWGKIE